MSSSASATTWEQHTDELMMKFADAVDAAAGDCDKLATGIASLAGNAKTLRAELVASGHKLAEYKPSATLTGRMNKDPGLLDRCEKNPRVSAALDATLLTIQPLGESDPAFGNAAGDAVGKAAATK